MTAKRKFTAARFVCWDGEGVGDHYTLLAAYWIDYKTGKPRYEYISNSGGLDTSTILYFVQEIAQLAGKRAIHVGFSLDYDWTHWMYDLAPSEAEKALLPTWKLWGKFQNFRVKARMRKELHIHYRNNHVKTNVLIWDVFGFFQSSFVTAVRKWLGSEPSYSELVETIARGKLARKRFDEWSVEEIVAYNKAELIALHEMMMRLHAAFRECDITLRRWDGGGAAASALFQKHMEREWWLNARLPKDLQEKAEHAYFGGRIEIMQYGVYNGPLWKYDLNSAYPSAMIEIPDLAHGRWIMRDPADAIPDFSICKVSWDVGPELIGPFAWRQEKTGRVVYPTLGRGWVWGVELNTALRHYKGIEIEEVWSYQPINPLLKPFSWVADEFARRRAYVQANNPAEKALKLALNSLYGKTAQRRGLMHEGKHQWKGFHGTYYTYEEERIPPYYNLAIAGWITALCRARVLDAANHDPTAIIAICTDGLFSMRDLGLPISHTKELGAWSLEYYPHAELVQVQSGVYFIRDGSRWIQATRGFGAVDDTLIERIQQGWRNHELSITLTEERFVGLRAALAQDYEKRGRWITQERQIQLTGQPHKRVAIDGSPANGLVRTRPNDLLTVFMTPSASYRGVEHIVYDDARQAFEESNISD